MSKETQQWLDTMTLTGFCTDRGLPWHGRSANLYGAGGSDNLYPHAIPMGHVVRRLFGWEPVTVDRPCKCGCGRVARDVEHSRTGHRFGTFGDGYQPHVYAPWLIGNLAGIVGEHDLADLLQPDMKVADILLAIELMELSKPDRDPSVPGSASEGLGIASAGLLDQGAVAWVQIEVPENIDSKYGMSYRPGLIAVTSFDGSVATTYKRVVTRVVCDNTLAAARGEKSETYRLKHTKYSTLHVADAREALAILEMTAGDFDAEVERLVATTVTDEQWFQFLDAAFPIPEKRVRLGKGGQPIQDQTHNAAKRKQDELTNLYRNDKRCEPWRGTALGVQQAVDTHARYIQQVNGAERAERVWSSTIKGIYDKGVAEAMTKLGLVLAA